MSEESKWAILAILILFVLPMLGLGVSQYQQHQCRIVGIEKGIPVNEIIKLCKETK